MVIMGIILVLVMPFIPKDCKDAFGGILLIVAIIATAVAYERG